MLILSGLNPRVPRINLSRFVVLSTGKGYHRISSRVMPRLFLVVLWSSVYAALDDAVLLFVFDGLFDAGVWTGE